jgi:predicted peptidase
MNVEVNPGYPNKINFFVVVSCLFLFSCLGGSFDYAGVFYKNTGSFIIEDNAVYKYLLYLPKDYGKTSSRKYPLLIYLHGKSCRGYNLEKLKKYGLPYLINEGWNFPFIVVSPQCPPDRIWNTDDWFPYLYKSLSSKYRIDRNRIYLTGMSMGGSGVWALAIKHPEYFAAAIPLCGGWSTKNIIAMKDIPVWAFHGANDKIVVPKETEKMVDALRKVGGRVRFSKLEGEGHSIHKVYERKKIYEWLLGHRR